MGLVWKKNAGGDWDPGSPMIKKTTGWVYGNTVYKKTGATTWSVIWTRKNTAPNKPVLALVSYAQNVTDKKWYLNMTVKAPADVDITRMVFKYSTAAYPKTANKDAQTNNTPMKDGGTFSEFAVEPGKTYTRSIPVANTKAGTQYFVSAWAQDSGFNWSSAANYLYTIATKAVVTPVPPGPVTRSGTVTTTDSASWNDVSNYWRTDNNYVYEGGYYWHGFWFYSTKIDALTKKAKRITNMTVTITRANTAHGVTGQADIYLTAHTLATQPVSNPNTTDTPGIKVGTLGRGQTKTFTVPSAWWPLFLSGHYKGLGMFNTQTSFTDVRYAYCYGAGTTSGRIGITWEEGV